MYREFFIIFVKYIYKNCNNNDFTPSYFKLGNFNFFKYFIIMRFMNLNYITNSCNLYTYVTWRGNEYELPEDDTIVSKHVGAW